LRVIEGSSEYFEAMGRKGNIARDSHWDKAGAALPERGYYQVFGIRQQAYKQIDIKEILWKIIL